MALYIVAGVVAVLAVLAVVLANRSSAKAAERFTEALRRRDQRIAAATWTAAERAIVAAFDDDSVGD